MSTVSAPTDFGLAAVPAWFLASLMATVWWLLTAWASPAVVRDEYQRAGDGQREGLTQLSAPGIGEARGRERCSLHFVKLTDRKCS